MGLTAQGPRIPVVPGRRRDRRAVPALRRRRCARETFPSSCSATRKRSPGISGTAADAARPLTARGTKQAAAAVGPLRAFGIRRIVSSDAVRCVDGDPARRGARPQDPPHPAHRGRMPGRRAPPTPARSSVSACGRASPPCSCGPRPVSAGHPQRTRARDRHDARLVPQRPRRSNRALSRWCICRRRTRARASSRSRPTNPRSDPRSFARTPDLGRHCAPRVVHLPFTGTAHALKSRCLPSRTCPAPGRLSLTTRRISQ